MKEASPDDIRSRLLHMGISSPCAARIVATYRQLGPAGVVARLPSIETSRQCTGLTQETIGQIMVLSACLPRYGAEVCLTPQ